MSRKRMLSPEHERPRYRGLTTAWIADDLGCTQEHVVELIHAGRHTAVDIGSAKKPEYRVAADSYTAYLRDQTVEPQRAESA